MNEYHFLISRLYFFFLQITDQNLITNYISNKKIDQPDQENQLLNSLEERERRIEVQSRERKRNASSPPTDACYTQSQYLQLEGTLPTFNTLNFNKGPDNYCKSNEEFPKTASIYDG